MDLSFQSFGDSNDDDGKESDVDGFSVLRLGSGPYTSDCWCFFDIGASNER